MPSRPLQFVQCFVILVSLLVFIGCWGKQDHDLLLPNTPHYPLTGSVKNIDTQDPVGHAKVIISSVAQIYAIHWEPTTIYTDSTGLFTVDTIYPGSYLATIYQNDFKLQSAPFMVLHEPKSMAIDLPAPLLADSHTFGYDLDEITWAGSALWGRQIFTGQIGPTYYGPPGVPALIKLQPRNGILERDVAFLDPSQNARGLTYSNSRILIYSSDSVYSISNTNGTLNATIPLHDRVTGLTVSQGIFYSTWLRSIQVRGTDMAQVVSSIQTTSQALSFLAKKGDYFWAYDQDRDFLVKIDAGGQVVRTFKLFSEVDNQHMIPKGFTLDGTQHLWISHNLSSANANYYSVFNLD